jgi:hypothetical protein
MPNTATVTHLSAFDELIIGTSANKQHPFKTYIGRIKDEGFNFLGYRLDDKKVRKFGVVVKQWYGAGG